MANANAIFVRLLRTIFHKPQISRLTKALIYSALVASVILYTSETWPLTQSHKMKVDAVQTKHIREIEPLGGLTRHGTRICSGPLNHHPCPNSLSSTRCVGTVIYFAYPLKHLPDLYSTSIQLQAAGNTPEADHVWNGLISSMIDSHRQRSTYPRPKQATLETHNGTKVWFPLRWCHYRPTALSKYVVKVGNEVRSWFHIPSGFKQVCVLSPPPLHGLFWWILS